MAFEEISVVIEEEIGALSAPTQAGWTKELNLVAWNGLPAKFDLREWDPDHERMSRGITLTESEARTLQRLLDEYFG